MQPHFVLPTGYTVRDMQFVLSRHLHGWKFFGHADGYSVPARNVRGEELCAGFVFATRGEAAIMAKAMALPAYAIWNGRKRRYDGEGAIIRAVPREQFTFPISGE